jgi:hypothetical protein
VRRGTAGEGGSGGEGGAYAQTFEQVLSGAGAAALLGSDADLYSPAVPMGVRAAVEQKVPEPAALGLLALGVLAVLVRRRRR